MMTPPVLSRWLGPGVVVIVTLATIAWTWRYCPDPVIDFAREIYISWRMSEGQALYRDLNYFDGPLGPYGVTAVFAVFGVSLDTLKTANAVVVVLTGLLIYSLTRAMSDRIAATAAGVTFAVVFATAQLSWDASFNWLTPYSHNLTWGIALSIAMIACLWRVAETGRAHWCAAAGTLLGLVVLAKAEVLLAALLASAAGVASVIWSRRLDRSRALRIVLSFAGCAVAVIVIAFVLLALLMPARDALASIAGALRHLGNRELLGMTYFRWLTGMDRPEQNLMQMLAWTGLYGCIVLPAVAVTWVARRSMTSNRARVIVAIVATSITLAVLVLASNRVSWTQAARPLPVMLLAVGASLLLQLLNRREGAHRLVLPLTLTFFGLVLLFKTILRTNLAHYGFALAMPGMVLIVAALVGWLPRFLARGDASLSWIARGMMLAMCGVFTLAILRASHNTMQARIYPVGSGHDRFLADARGKIIDDAQRFLQSDAQRSQTLVAIPEASLLNYLARMPSSVRYHNFLPSEVLLFGEQRMLEALRASPPDWIALVHADTRIYDAPYFGRDYGREIARWIQQNYVAEKLIGRKRPYTSDEFAVLIMKRRAQEP